MAKDEGDVRLNVTAKSIEKQHGQVLRWLGDAATIKRETIPTGCLGLDHAVGNNGFERGLVAEFFGETGAGKSFLAYSVMKQACLLGHKCAIVDAENSADPKLLLKVGLPADQILLVEGAPTGEANLSIADNLMSTGEFAVVLIDSVAALVPEARAEHDYDQGSIGLHARLMSAGLQKIVPVVKKTNTLLVFVNQIRNKVGGYGNPKTTTGGEALPFYASYRVEVIGSPQSKSRQLLDPISGELFGHRAKFKVVKNKRSAPYREAEVDLIYGVGYDNLGEVVDLSTDLGIVEKNKAWYYYKDFKWQGRDKFKLDLIGNKELSDELSSAVRAVIAGEPIPEHSEEKIEVETDAKPTSKKRKGSPGESTS